MLFDQSGLFYFDDQSENVSVFHRRSRVEPLRFFNCFILTNRQTGSDMAPKIINDEDKQQRQQVIMGAALELIRSGGGVGAVTIDKVVAKVPYSKGTVYGHYSSKEDLLTAMCNYCVSTLIEVFAAAIDFEGSTREKALCLAYSYLLHAQSDMTRFNLVVTAKTPATRAKASQHHTEEHMALEDDLNRLFCSVIVDAIENGELTPKPGMDAGGVAFAIWSMAYGTVALLQDQVERCAIRESQVLEVAYLTHTNLVLDGLGWQPLDNSIDLQALTRACHQRVAPQIKNHGLHKP